MWPCNLAAVNLFIVLGTQWRTGFGGATGLDYNVMYARMARMNLSDADFEDMEEAIRELEDAALKTMKDKK